MSKIPFHNCYRVSSLSQIYAHIRDIQEYAVKKHKSKPGTIPPLWYRGHEEAKYLLIPSLLRENKVKIHSMKMHSAYSSVHTQENQRHHVFRAKLNHAFEYQPFPTNQLEWQELMQHHSVNTRMLDWSETLHSALAFALRAALNPKNDETAKMKRASLDPVVWVLLPCELNDIVYKCLSSSEMIFHAVQNMDISRVRKANLVKYIFLNMQLQKDVYFDPSHIDKPHMTMDKLVNLSVIDQQLAAFSQHLPLMLKQGEYNPFHYLLSRYYSHALPTCKQLPPLATLHPYHSDRIRAQHGAFTIFPINTACNVCNKDYSEKNAMENIPGMSSCLFEIRITDAYRVAHELLLTGIRESNLFPEPEVYSREFEADRFYY